MIFNFLICCCILRRSHLSSLLVLTSEDDPITSFPNHTQVLVLLHLPLQVPLTKVFFASDQFSPTSPFPSSFAALLINPSSIWKHSETRCSSFQIQENDVIRKSSGKSLRSSSVVKPCESSKGTTAATCFKHFLNEMILTFTFWTTYTLLNLHLAH